MAWAIEAGKVDTRGLEFEPVASDIQTLNEWAVEGRLEVTALSAGAYPAVADRYVLLPHGASFGEGYGPIVVARERASTCARSRSSRPGALTTATRVLKLALGDDVRTRDLPFDEVLDEVVSGRAEAGLLIHEGQLTYAEHGLRKLLDLGVWWQRRDRPAAAARRRRRAARPRAARRRLGGDPRGDRRRAREPRRGDARTRSTSAAASTPAPPTSSSRCTSTT